MTDFAGHSSCPMTECHPHCDTVMISVFNRMVVAVIQKLADNASSRFLSQSVTVRILLCNNSHYRTELRRLNTCTVPFVGS